MATIIRAVVFGSLTGGILITGNFFYVHRTWKYDHPLINETLRLLYKDPAVAEHLGPNPDVKSGIDGILIGGKNWANVSFTVSGAKGSGRVSLLADAKYQDELTKDAAEFPLQGSAPSYPYITLAKCLVGMGVCRKDAPFWRILSLHLKPDETRSFPVVADGLRTHRQLLQETEVKSAEEQPAAGFLASRERREQTYRMAQKRWIMMAGLTATTLALFFLVRRYMKVFPVANSVFMNQTLEIISTDVWVRNNLGVPVKNLQFVKGHLNYNRTKGRLETLVYGPKNYGKLVAAGQFDKKLSKWVYSVVNVKIENTVRSLVAETPARQR